MGESILSAISLAGFLFAQVFSVATDVPKPALTPVAFVSEGSVQKFTFFDGQTLDAMVENGRHQLHEGNYERWAFAYEGYVLREGKRTEALFVEAWTKGLSRPVLVVQLWHRNSLNVPELIGDPMFMDVSEAPKVGKLDVKSARMLSDQEKRAFSAGIEQLQELRKKGFIGGGAETGDRRSN